MCVVYIYWFIHMLYISLMAGWEFGFGWGKGRPRKYSLLSRTHAPSTTSTAPASTTPTIATTSTPPSHCLYIQEFVMIPNFGYLEPRPQPSFPPQPSPSWSPPLGGEARTSSVPNSTPSSTPSQLGSKGVQASSCTSSQGSTTQHVELRYNGKSW